MTCVFLISQSPSASVFFPRKKARHPTITSGYRGMTGLMGLDEGDGSARFKQKKIAAWVA
ncbi:hypothetical protein EMIT0P176_540003 [Pseudomonas sp. IT-P176]